MEERRGHLTVVIGASGLAEDLRRTLVQHDVTHAGVATHLRGLRKSIVLNQSDLVVVCIAMDQPTLRRHGKSLRQLLADNQCFPQAVRSVGLLTDIGLSRDAAELGCDLYVDNSMQAATAVKLLTRRWKRDQKRSTVSARSKSTKSSSRFAVDSKPSSWMWGTDVLPRELASIAAADPIEHEGAEGQTPPARRIRDIKPKPRRRSPSS